MLIFNQMQAQKISIISIDQKDTIRTCEQNYELRLKKELAKLGFWVEFDKISHHGLKNIQLTKK